jgi:phosphatidylglycerol:prolipoprotein diacylglycerol transferase
VYPILFRLPEWVPFLGGDPITSFGVMMFLAFVVAGVVVRSELVRKGHEGDLAWDFLFMAVIGGIVGAKLYYVLLNFDRFQAEGLSFVFSRGGMVWYGGFLLAAALVAWEARKSPVPVPRVADAVAPALAIGYAVGRIGCFLVGDDYGRPTDSWVGIAFPDGAPATTVENLENQFGVAVDPALVEKYGNVIPVHPTQLYEVGMSTLIFAVLWALRGGGRPDGWLFMLWLALAGVERFVVEIFRAKDDRFFGIFTLAQFISVGLVVVGVVGVMRLGGRGSAQRAAAAGG